MAGYGSDINGVAPPQATQTTGQLGSWGGSVAGGGPAVPDAGWSAHTAPNTAASCAGGKGFGGCGNPWWWGGGGGGGYFGGSGGVDTGGGGGSSLPFFLSNYVGEDGFKYTPGGQDDPFYEPGIGAGGLTAQQGAGSGMNPFWTATGSGNTGGAGWQWLTSGAMCPYAAVGAGGPGLIIIEEFATPVTPPRAVVPAKMPLSPGEVIADARAGPPLPFGVAPLWSLASVVTPNLLVWLDPIAFVGQAAGASVPGWPNRGALAVGPVATSVAQQPVVRLSALNGWPVLSFSAISLSQLAISGSGTPVTVRVASLPISFPWSYLVVARMSSGANNNRIISQAAPDAAPNSGGWVGPWHGGWARRFMSGNVNAYTSMGGTGGGIAGAAMGTTAPGVAGPHANGTAPVLADTLWHTYIVTYHGPRSMSAWEDGVLLGRNLWLSGDAAYATPDGITLNGPGKFADGASTEWSDCEIAEVMMWTNTALAPVDVAGLHAYVADKFGLPLGGVGLVDGSAGAVPPNLAAPAPACVTTSDAGRDTLVTASCTAVAPACCSLPARGASANALPVWTAILTADGTVDATKTAFLVGSSLPHLLPVSTPVAVLRAADADDGAAGMISYALSGPAAPYFSLRQRDAGAGVTLVVKSALVPLNTVGWANVTVTATDGVGGTAPPATVAFPVAASFFRPLFVSPAIIRVSRPGSDRLEVAEIAALTPAGVNVAAGALVSTNDAHYAWNGVVDHWAPQPAFLATDGNRMTYASAWTGFSVTEPSTALGDVPGTFQPRFDVALGAHTELASVVVTLRSECAGSMSPCFGSLTGFRVSALAYAANGSLVEVGSALGPTDATVFFDGAVPTVTLALPLVSPLTISNTPVIDSAPVLSAFSRSLSVSDVVAVGAVILSASAVATDVDSSALPAGTLSFASATLVSPLNVPIAGTLFALNGARDALIVNGSVATAMLGGLYSVTLSLVVADGVGVTANGVLTVTISLSSTAVTAVLTCPAGWSRPPSSAQCFKPLVATPTATVTAWAGRCASPAWGGVAGGTLANPTSDVEAAFIFGDGACGLPGGRSTAQLYAYGSGVSAAYAVNTTGRTGSWMGGPGSWWWALGEPAVGTSCAASLFSAPVVVGVACTRVVGAACCALPAINASLLVSNTPPDAAPLPVNASTPVILVPAGPSIGGGILSAFAATDPDASVLLDSPSPGIRAPAATIRFAFDPLPIAAAACLTPNEGTGEIAVCAGGLSVSLVGSNFTVIASAIDGLGARSLPMRLTISVVAAGAAGAATLSPAAGAAVAAGAQCPQGWFAGGFGSTACYAPATAVFTSALNASAACRALDAAAVPASFVSAAEAGAAAAICSVKQGVGAAPWFAGVPPINASAAATTPADAFATALGASPTRGVESDATALLAVASAGALGRPSSTPPTSLSPRNSALVVWLAMPASAVAFNGARVSTWSNLAGTGVSRDFVQAVSAQQPVARTVGAPPGAAYVEFDPAVTTQSLTIKSNLSPFAPGGTIFVVTRARPGAAGTTFTDKASGTTKPWFFGHAQGLLGVVHLGGDFLADRLTARYEAGNTDGAWHLYTVAFAGPTRWAGDPVTASAWLDGSSLAVDATSIALGKNTSINAAGQFCLGNCNVAGWTTPDMDVGEVVIFANTWGGVGLAPAARVEIEAYLMGKWGVVPLGAASNATAGYFPAPPAQTGSCVRVSGATGAASLADCTTPAPVCCALRRAGAVTPPRKPVWTGVAAAAIAAVNATANTPIVRLPVALSSAPVGYALVSLSAYANGAGALFFSLPDGAMSGALAINAATGDVTVAKSPLPVGPVSFRVAVVSAGGLAPAAAATVNVSFTVVPGYNLTCAFPVVQRVRFVFAPAGSLPLAVKEVAVRSPDGTPIPAANLSVTTRTTGFYSSANGNSCGGAACSAAGIPRLFDGVFDAFGNINTLTVSGFGAATLNRFVEVSVNADAGAPVASVAMWLSETNTSTFPTPPQIVPITGSWFELWSTTSQTWKSDPSTALTLTRGDASTGYAWIYSADVRAAGCAAADAASLTSLNPVMTLQWPAVGVTAWYLANSPPRVSLFMPTATLAVVAVPAGSPLYVYASQDAGGAVVLGYSGAPITIVAVDDDIGVAGPASLSVSVTGVGSGDFSVATSDGGATWVLSATVLLNPLRRSAYSLSFVAVDGMGATSAPFTLTLTVTSTYQATFPPAPVTWRAQVAPYFLTDFAYPNNALSVPAYAAPNTNLSTWLAAADADTPTLLAGALTSFTVTVTGWVPAGVGSPLLPAASFAPPPGACGSRACGTQRAVFSGFVRGRNALTGAWALGVTYVGGAIDFEVTAAWVVTLVIADGLGGSATALGVPIYVSAVNAPVGWAWASGAAVVPANVGGGFSIGNVTRVAPATGALATAPAASFVTAPLSALLVDVNAGQAHTFALFSVAMSTGAAAFLAGAPGGAAAYANSIFAVDGASGYFYVANPLAWNGTLVPPAITPSLWFAVTISTSDAPLFPGDATTTANVVVNVTVAEVNVAPMGVVNATGIIASTATAGTPVTPLFTGPLATDANAAGPSGIAGGAWGTLVFSLAPALPQDAAVWTVNASTGSLTYAGAVGVPSAALWAALFDGAAARAVVVVVRATDGGGLWVDVPVRILVQMAASASAAPSTSVAPSLRESQSAGASQSMTATPVSASSSPTGTPSSSSTNIPSPSQTTTVSSSPTPTPTPTSTVSSSVTPTATRTGTGTPTASVTKGASASNSPGPTLSSTGSDSSSTTPSLSSTSTTSATAVSSGTGTSSVTQSSSGTATPSSSATGAATASTSTTGTATPSESGTGTATPSVSGTGTATPSGTLSTGASPSSTPSAESTPSSSSTLSSSSTSTGTPSSSSTMSTTATPTPSSTASPSSTSTSSTTATLTASTSPASASSSPASTPSSTSTASESSTPTPTPTSTVSLSASPTATRTGTGTPTSSLTNGASASNSPGPTLSSTSSDSPSTTPSLSSTSTTTTSAVVSASASTTTSVTATTSPTPTASLSFGATPSTSPSVSSTPSPTSTVSPSQTPSGTGSKTVSTSATPTTTLSSSTSPTSTPSTTLSATPTPTPSSSTTVSASGTSARPSAPSTAPSGSPAAIDSPSPSVCACSVADSQGGGVAAGNSANSLSGAAGVTSPTGLGIVGFAAGSIVIVIISAVVYTRKAFVAMRAAELTLALERERRGAKPGAPAPPPGRPPAWSLESWKRGSERVVGGGGGAEGDTWAMTNPLKAGRGSAKR